MWRALIILILSIGILGGGFYYFADHEGWFEREISDERGEGELIVNNETEDSGVLVEVRNDWLDYTYKKEGVLFSTKYPADSWKVLEQLNANNLTIVFTNNDSCQVMYLFDIRQGQYKTELSNNQNSDACADVLRKIVSIATIPQFGVIMTEEDETQSDPNLEKSQDGVTSAGLAMTDEAVEDSTTVKDPVTTDTKDATSEPVVSDEPVKPVVISEAIPDQELHEMSAKERYESAKAFVNNYLLEYAKRRWATLENQLSAKAKVTLGSKTLSSVATPFYYYELLTVLKEIQIGQFQVNVKLTTKEDEAIGSGDGIYTLNVVWEYGEWKMDNYLFE